MPDSALAQILCAGGFLVVACAHWLHRVFHDERRNIHNVKNKFAALQEIFSLQEINFHIEKYDVKFIEFKRKNICLV
ncbi:hypothetical protein [Hydrogenophaga sp.]|uniref:hypothetical protein n=1 Tax=Hydrogenophaga sp. TaxID=1904254 RepID=UPI003F6CB681